MLQNDLDQSNTYKAQYNDFSGQATAANQAVKNYTGYMEGEGSAANQYHSELGKQLGDLGYDPAQMTAARGNVNQAVGALSAYSDFANTAASKWGMNAGGFAAANSNALSGLNNNIATNQNVVNGLGDLYKTAQTGANQFTGNVIQGQHETMAGLQEVFTNASNQRDNAGQMMSFFSDLASKQGGLNAQQQQYYAQAQQAYAAATQALAQASLFSKQSALAQQQFDNQQKLYADQQKAAAAKQAVQSYTNGGLSWNGQYDPNNSAKIFTGSF